MEKNDEHRKQRRRIADPGKGFMLGQSGNPEGRVLVYEALPLRIDCPKAK